MYLFLSTLFFCAHKISLRIIRTEAEETSLVPTQKESAFTLDSQVVLKEKPAEKKKKDKKTTKTTTTVVKPVEPETVFDGKIKQLQEETDREIAELKQKKEQRLTAIKRTEELEKIILQQKELERELEKLNAKELLKTEPIEDRMKLSLDWKLTETARFNRLSTELADTIASGEEDEGELNDFKELFNAQREWFDHTMSDAKFVGDENYTAIMDRNSRLDLLLKAQRIALPILMKEINIKKVSKSDFDRASTILLYELNTKLTDPDDWNGKLPEEVDVFHELVITSIEESKDPAFLKATPANKMVNSLQKKLLAAHKSIEEKNKRVIELEMTIGSNKDKITILKKDVAQTVTEKKASEEKLKKIEETSTQDIAALKAEKTKIESQLTQAQNEAKDVKIKLDSAAADSTKTHQEKQELQTQSKDLAKKIEDLQEKKHVIEKELEEEQHKRRELEIKVEQTKFKQEQAEIDRKKLTEENTKLDSHRKELSEQLDSKNKQIMDLSLQLEQIRRELGAQSIKVQKQSVKALSSMKQDFEKQIHELKIMMLKQKDPTSPDISKEESIFNAKLEAVKDLAEEQALAEAITPEPISTAIQMTSTTQTKSSIQNKDEDHKKIHAELDEIARKANEYFNNKSTK
jgi:hypothetical protein